MTGKAFSVMQTNVGNMLHDTTSAMKTLIKVWINDAYQDAWRRGIWSDLIDENFTFESVVDQADYVFTSGLSITNFGKELGVFDIANGHELKRYTVQDWWRRRGPDHDADSLESGNPSRYVILKESGSIRLDPPPDTAETYAMPYQKEVTDLSADANTPAITTISTYLEYFAIGMGFSYKKELDLADWWMNKAEFELAKLIKEEKVKVNQIYQRVLAGYSVSRETNLLGDKSYDSV